MVVLTLEDDCYLEVGSDCSGSPVGGLEGARDAFDNPLCVKPRLVGFSHNYVQTKKLTELSPGSLEVSHSLIVLIRRLQKITMRESQRDTSD